MSLVEYQTNGELIEPPLRQELLPPIFKAEIFDQMQRIARMMAFAPLVPEHLKGRDINESLANCLLVVNQSLKWRMDPFAVAQETFVFQGKIGYSGKLVAAALQSCLNIKLYYYFEGTGEQRKIIVRDRPKGEDTDRVVEGTFEQWVTKDKNGNINQSWKKQPDDMLIYRGTRQWCRRYEPQVILGVLTADELKEIRAESARDVTPRKAPPPAPKLPASETQEAETVAEKSTRKGPPPAPKTTPPSAPPPAPPPASETVAEAEIEPPFADPRAYVDRLADQLDEAQSFEELHEIWLAHLEVQHRLPPEWQTKAEEQMRLHRKRFQDE